MKNLLRNFLSLLLLLIIGSDLHAAVRTSVSTGDWSNTATWDCACIPANTDDAVISSGHKVTLTTNTTIANLTISASAIMYNRKNNFTITGNYIVDGDHVGDNDTYLTGVGTNIGGTGTIHEADLRVTGNKTIVASAKLTKAFGRFRVESGTEITNNGTMTIGGELKASDGTSIWTNASGSTLNVKEELFDSTGILNASAPKNIVRYYGSLDQFIKIPATSYAYLTLVGGGNKILLGNIQVDADITVASLFTASNYTIDLYGDWHADRGIFDEGTGAVNMLGSTDQEINNMNNETFYHLVVNKPSGELILNDTVIVSNTLDMTSGNIDASAACLVLGTSLIQEGSLLYTDGWVIGDMRRWINTLATNFLFPIGTSSEYRGASIVFNLLTGGTLTASFMEKTPGNNGLALWDAADSVHNTFVEGYWTFTEDLLVSLDYDLIVGGTGFSSFSIDSSTRLVYRITDMDPWTANGTHMDSDSITAVRTSMSGFGQYALADTTPCSSPVTSVITGSDSVCKNVTSVVYSVTNTAGSTYDWSITGGTITSGQGTNTITVDWGNTGMEGQVSVTETNSCSEGVPIDTAIAIHPLPTSVITGKINVSDFSTGEPYSVVARSGYTYAWTITGGTVASGGGTNAITVDWGAAGIGEVAVIGSNACGKADTQTLAINIYVPINSTQTGNWGDVDTWNCKCVPMPMNNVRIMSTHTVTLDSTRDINHFEVQAGGVFDDNNKTLQVTGDLTIDGEYDGRDSLILSGAGTVIDGVGEFTHDGDIWIDAGSKDILSTAFLKKDTGDINILDVYTVTNYGTFEVGDDIAGAKNNSQWVNEASSKLTIGGVLMNTGKLFATATNNEVVYNGSTNQTIKRPVANTYYRLTINKPSGIANMPANNLKVTELDLQLGNIDLGVYKMIMLDGGSIIGHSASSYLIADGGGACEFNVVNPGLYEFPIGDNDEYSPISVTLNSGTYNSNAYLRAFVVDAVHPTIGTTNYITRYWDVHAKFFTAIDYDVSYYYQEVDTVGDENTLLTAHYDTDLSTWNFYDAVNGATNNVFSTSGITTIPNHHEFTAGNGVALPIELLTFTATVNGGNVDLEWETAVEINNDFFTIERSADGLNFEPIAMVKGAGTSYFPSSYSNTDVDPYTGISYYRLRQTDFDGMESLSDPVAVNIAVGYSTPVKLYPNPLVGSQPFNLELGIGKEEQVIVVLTDAFGRQVWSKVMVTNGAGTLAGIKAPELPAGVYFVTASSSISIFQKRLVISSSK